MATKRNYIYIEEQVSFTLEGDKVTGRFPLAAYKRLEDCIKSITLDGAMLDAHINNANNEKITAHWDRPLQNESCMLHIRKMEIF